VKRWAVDLIAGRVELAVRQDRAAPEYAPLKDFAFVMAVDELGAFVRAKQLIAEQDK
jgi:hypothetical protein